MLHKLHRFSAIIIGAYILVHLYNHLLALDSVQTHIQFMHAFRHIYRNPVVETILLVCVGFQIISGVIFLKNRWGLRQGFFERLQALSGGYLAFFLLIHVGAVLFGRGVLHLDTNFYYAAAGMHVYPYQFFFIPYYFLAVVAIFGHVACAMHWLTRNRLPQNTRNNIGYLMLALGVLTSTLIVTAFAGGFYNIQIPQEYLATYHV